MLVKLEHEEYLYILLVNTNKIMYTISFRKIVLLLLFCPSCKFSDHMIIFFGVFFLSFF